MCKLWFLRSKKHLFRFFPLLSANLVKSARGLLPWPKFWEYKDISSSLSSSIKISQISPHFYSGLARFMLCKIAGSPEDVTWYDSHSMWLSVSTNNSSCSTGHYLCRRGIFLGGTAMTLDSLRRCLGGGPTGGTGQCWDPVWGRGCSSTAGWGDLGLFLARFVTKYLRLCLLSRIDVPCSSYWLLLPNTCRHVIYKVIHSCLMCLSNVESKTWSWRKHIYNVQVLQKAYNLNFMSVFFYLECSSTA